MNSVKGSKHQNIREGTFPYLATGPATNSDGTLGASNEGSDLSVNYPQTTEPTRFSTRGSIIAAGIGNTDYIDTNTVAHSVLAGNS